MSGKLNDWIFCYFRLRLTSGEYPGSLGEVWPLEPLKAQDPMDAFSRAVITRSRGEFKINSFVS